MSGEELLKTIESICKTATTNSDLFNKTILRLSESEDKREENDEKMAITVAEIKKSFREIKITQTYPDWLEEQSKEYNILKAAENKKRPRKPWFPSGQSFNKMLFAALIISLILITTYAVWQKIDEKKQANSAQAFAERAYDAAVRADFELPGDCYHDVRRYWANGEIDSAKKLTLQIEHTAMSVEKVKNELSYYSPNETIVVTYLAEEKDDILVRFHVRDDQPEFYAHFWPDGKIDVAAAAKITLSSLEDAHRKSKNKAWQTIKVAEPASPVEQ